MDSNKPSDPADKVPFTPEIADAEQAFAQDLHALLAHYSAKLPQALIHHHLAFHCHDIMAYIVKAAREGIANGTH